MKNWDIIREWVVFWEKYNDNYWCDMLFRIEVRVRDGFWYSGGWCVLGLGLLVNWWQIHFKKISGYAKQIWLSEILSLKNHFLGDNPIAAYLKGQDFISYLGS